MGIVKLVDRFEREFNLFSREFIFAAMFEQHCVVTVPELTHLLIGGPNISIGAQLSAEEDFSMPPRLGHTLDIGVDTVLGGDLGDMVRDRLRVNKRKASVKKNRFDVGIFFAHGIGTVTSTCSNRHRPYSPAAATTATVIIAIIQEVV